MGTRGWYQGCTRAWRLHVLGLHGGDTEGCLPGVHERRAREYSCDRRDYEETRQKERIQPKHVFRTCTLVGLAYVYPTSTLAI